MVAMILSVSEVSTEHSRAKEAALRRMWAINLAQPHQHRRNTDLSGGGGSGADSAAVAAAAAAAAAADDRASLLAAVLSFANSKAESFNFFGIVIDKPLLVKVAYLSIYLAMLHGVSSGSRY